VLVEKRGGALFVVQERDDFLVDLRVELGHENDDATARARLRRPLLADVYGASPVYLSDQGEAADATEGDVR
jgi:hypothetical protein